MDATTAEAGTRPRLPEFGAVIAVLGVVYGDIGTSPLYAFKAALGLFGERGVSDLEILGVLSLIFWSLVVVVTVKYVTLIMRADNRGEGGVLALMALAQRVCVSQGMRSFVLLVGIGGACLFFGSISFRAKWSSASNS
jgi:KUP system potassium uptake protein